jgi:hypothetical protein
LAVLTTALLVLAGQPSVGGIGVRAGPIQVM